MEAALERVRPRGAVVGRAMPDYIANLWTSYYVQRAGLHAALVSHDDFPDEDAVLPDASGKVINSAGTQLVYKPRYYAERPPYLLLEGEGNLNREITARPGQAPPLWSNGAFTLVERARVRDVLITGRGFHRLEYFDPKRFPYWWPDRMRWTSTGGEFLLLNASHPGEPYRLSVLIVAGVQRERPRHVEVWAGGRKIDEVVVHGAARILSAPFVPKGELDKIVLRVRERVDPVPRNFGLWNRHIALDQRLLNMVVTQARVVREGEAPAASPRGLFTSRDLIDRSRDFNGLSLDGWAAPSMHATLPIEPGAERARLRVEVPGWANYRFPLKVAAEVNGVRHVHELPGPGTHTVEWKLDAAARELAIKLESDQSIAVPGVGTSTFRIEALSIE
jgi:hypothetical protein